MKRSKPHDQSDEVEGGNLIMETKMMNRLKPLRSNSLKSQDNVLNSVNDYQSEDKYYHDGIQRSQGGNNSMLTKLTDQNPNSQMPSVRRQSSMPYENKSKNDVYNAGNEANNVKKSFSSIQEDDLDSGDYEVNGLQNNQLKQNLSIRNNRH